MGVISALATAADAPMIHATAHAAKDKYPYISKAT